MLARTPLLRGNGLYRRPFQVLPCCIRVKPFSTNCQSQPLQQSSNQPSLSLSAQPNCIKRKVNVGDSAQTEKVFNMDDVRQYAFLSTDSNPLHIDPEYASKTRFKAPIVHGLLTASLLSAVVGTKLPGEGSIYISQVLHFKRPVYVGDKIIAKVEVTNIQKAKKIITLSTKCVSITAPPPSSTHENNASKEKIVIEGEATIFFPELDTS